MKKKFIYKCMFTSTSTLCGSRSQFTIRVRCYTLEEAKKHLRSLGFHLGKDFVYWKLPDNSCFISSYL